LLTPWRSAHDPAALQTALKPFSSKRDLRPWDIIDGVSGVLKPGRLILLLGTLGSGRSLLMRALAGRLRRQKVLKVSS
jgi:ABC-type hemin transport system ATPase subunit